MRFAASKFAPLMVHTAMEPGDAVALPGQIVEDCRAKGFQGCAMIGRTNLLAIREALHHTRSLGSRIQGRFKVVAGLEVSLRVKQQQVCCVLLARDQIGWQFLLSSLTQHPECTGEVKLEEECTGDDQLEVECSGPVQLELDELKAAKGHLILLVRPEGAGIKPGVLKAIAKAMRVMVPIKVNQLRNVKKRRPQKVVMRVKKAITRTRAITGKLQFMPKRMETVREKRVPTTYLALPGRNRVHERLGRDTGITPVAAPDIHCMHRGQETVLKDWRAILKLRRLNSQRCLNLHSRNALVQRFAGRRELLERSAEILDAIDNYDYCVRPEPDAGAARQLEMLVHTGPRPRIRTEAPPDAYRQRLQEELRQIIGQGMERLFVTAAAISQRMRSAKVPSEPHQGHLGNSLAARMLSLTTIDPVRDGLLFRNFLMPGMARRPTIKLTFGVGAKLILNSYLEQAYTCLDRPLQVIHLDPVTCAEKLSSRFKLEEEDLNALLEAMRKVAVKVGSGASKIEVSIPSQKGLRRAIAIAPILARLPWRVAPHPTDLLVNPWRPVSLGHRIAPISSEDASAFGYLPLTIVLDPQQDTLKQQRLSLTEHQKRTVVEALHSRDHRRALRLAIDMWSRDVRLIPTGYQVQKLFSGDYRPKTFDDLIALHGFLQDKEIDWKAIQAHFNLVRPDSKYLFYKHPILKPIIVGTRGQILWGEQCFRLMVEALKLNKNQAYIFLSGAANDPQHATECWQRYASKIKKRAHVPRNPPVAKGIVLHVKNAPSSQRREMYERNQMDERPPMSIQKVKALHVMLGEVLGQTRSKALALAAALRAYEQALLKLTLK